jgi:hypothetical protein
LFLRGRFAEHEGRQNIPVDETAKTNLPSWLASRASTACHRLSSPLGIVAVTCSLSIALVVMATKIEEGRSADYPNLAVKRSFMR